MKYKFHGTNRKIALSIIEQGYFNKGTHFAAHLEDSLEMGGSWVFIVEFDDSVSEHWQFISEDRVPLSKVKRLTQYRPIVRIGTQAHLTRKIDSKQESINLIGIPLTI